MLDRDVNASLNRCVESVDLNKPLKWPDSLKCIRLPNVLRERRRYCKIMHEQNEFLWDCHYFGHCCIRFTVMISSETCSWMTPDVVFCEAASLIAGTSIVWKQYSSERAEILSDAVIYERLNAIRCVYARFHNVFQSVTFDCENEALWALGLRRFCASTSGIRVPLFSGFLGLGSEGGGT